MAEVWDCEYVRDGVDTDGTVWFTCLVHGQDIGDTTDIPCAGWYPPPSPHGDGTVSPERALCEDQSGLYQLTRGVGSDGEVM